MKLKKLSVFFILIELILSKNCIAKTKEKTGMYHEKFFTVTATNETEAVLGSHDAADDVAIWFHPDSPLDSIILASDKKIGISVFNLSGHKIYSYNGDPYNNIDIRYDLPTEKSKIDIIAATNVKKMQIDFFKISKTKDLLVKIPGSITLSKVSAYGLCMYHHRQDNKYYVIATGRKGKAEQYEIWFHKNKIKSRLTRTFPIPTKNEGCVSHDEHNVLYIAEEEIGIWKFDLNNNNDKGKFLDTIKNNKNLVRDIEGLSIYHLDADNGYLIASIQGNSSFAVYDIKTDQYLLSFKVKASKNIDELSYTDGIEIINMPLGKKFPSGMMIAQDDSNEDKGKEVNQNFKLISWSDISKADPNHTLKTKSIWNPRK